MHENEHPSRLKILLVLLVLALLSRISYNKFESEKMEQEISARAPSFLFDGTTYIFRASSSFLNLESGREFVWRDRLAKAINGEIEKSVTFGIIDVLTSTEAIEVEYYKKWHEGIGQALHYAYDTKKQGVLALIVCEKDNPRKVEYIRSICETNNVKLIILKER